MKHANVGIFVPHNGCLHQCSFCNQWSITGQCEQPSPQDVRQAAEIAKKTLKGRSQEAEIAFFGGSFTAIDENYMLSLLQAAFPYIEDGAFSGIRISTRPDAIDSRILNLLKEYRVTAIELGAQSMDDNVLLFNRRGHTADQVKRASELIRQYGFSLGLQMMTGLWRDTKEGAIRTAQELIRLSPDTVRIYPTIVMEHTLLAEKYRAGEYVPMSLEEAIDLCSKLLYLFEDAQISVIRLGLHSTPQLEAGKIAGPYHPAFRELCESRQFFKKVRDWLQLQKIPCGLITLKINPRYRSRAVGCNKKNLLEWKRLGYQITIVEDEGYR